MWARVAQRFGFARTSDGAVRVASRSHVAMVLLSDIDGEGVEDVLLQPFSAFVEVADESDRPDDLICGAAAAQDFYLNLSTGTAIGLRTACLVCDTLGSRGVLAAPRRSNVELCLHEAIANGLIHGNLGVESRLKREPGGYRLFSQTITDRLGDPDLRRRRIEVFARWDARFLEVGVADEGVGFDVAVLPPEMDDTMPSGRGFPFMRALAAEVSVGDGGRCTSLRFPL